MEASIIFHFAGRGSAEQRLALVDFAQLLDPRWKAPHEEANFKTVSTGLSFLKGFLHSTYNFVQGGMSNPYDCRVAFAYWFPGIAGALGATIVYPIDMGMYWISSCFTNFAD